MALCIASTLNTVDAPSSNGVVALRAWGTNLPPPVSHVVVVSRLQPVQVVSPPVGMPG